MPSNPFRYQLLHDFSPSLGDDNWRWCGKCQGLFHRDGGEGICPTGGTHNPTGSYNYRILRAGARPGESEWRRCQRCRGMFIASGSCPGGGSHDPTGSDAYHFDPKYQLG